MTAVDGHVRRDPHPFRFSPTSPALSKNWSRRGIVEIVFAVSRDVIGNGRLAVAVFKRRGRVVERGPLNRR